MSESFLFNRIAAKKKHDKYWDDYLEVPDNNFDRIVDPWLYFVLKEGAANQAEQKEAADHLKGRSNVVNALVEINSWKESVIYDKAIDKWVFRGNHYDTFVNAMMGEWRIAYRKHSAAKKTLMDEIIEATVVKS